MARSQAYETRALHAGGQCELSIIEFIYLVINCSAEVDRYIFIFDKNRVIRDTLAELCTKIKMLKVTSQLKKIKTKRRLHHPLLAKEDMKIKSCSHRLTIYLFWHNRVLFLAWPDLRLLLLLFCGIHLNLAGHLMLANWSFGGEQRGLHSEWLLPQPEIILMGTGVDGEPSTQSCNT